MTTIPRTPRQPVAPDEQLRRLFIMEGKIAAHATLYVCSDFSTRGHSIEHLACPFCGSEVHTPFNKLRQCTNRHSMVAMGNGLFAWPDDTAPREQILDDATPDERREQRIGAMARRGQWGELAGFLLENTRPPEETMEPTPTEPPTSPVPAPRMLRWMPSRLKGLPGMA